MLTQKKVRESLMLLEDQKEIYKDNHPAKEINWKTYEEKYFYRLQKAIFGYKYFIEKIIQLLYLNIIFQLFYNLQFFPSKR